jgi:hypothetical protein
MDATFSSFTGLIDPLQAEVFFSEFWEKKPLHIRRSNPHFYQDLLTLEDVQSVISYGGLRYPAIQLSKSGAFLHPDVFCTDIHSGDIVFSGVPDLDRLQAEYKSGATLSLPGFNRAWKPLRRLSAAVEAYLNHAVHTNIYITPGNTSGFKPHYDAHEVFILQISGGKHWEIYPPPLDLPHRSQIYQPEMHSPAGPFLELDMQPGDLLYLPRGWVHTTNTSESASMHVTLGVTVYTFVELMTVWLQSSKNELALRKALPPGFASSPELQQGIETEFAKLAEDFQQKLDAKQVLETFVQRVRDGYPGQSELGVEFELNAAVISPQTRIKALPGSEYTISEQGDNIVLKFKGRTLVMSNRARSTLDEMCRRASFQPSDLTVVLKEETLLALIRHLYQEGFLMLSQ